LIFVPILSLLRTFMLEKIFCLFLNVWSEAFYSQLSVLIRGVPG